jgi:hypothetical protein
LRAAARAAGHKTLAEDAVEKVRSKDTTEEEVTPILATADPL